MNRKSQHRTPPILAEWLLGILLKDKTAKSPLGDFEEFFQIVYEEKGRLAAYKWYWGQVLSILPRVFLNSILWGFVMLNNYLKIAFRNLFKSKGYSLINISGLAIGIACSLVILLYVQGEFSYDEFHEDAEDIYRIAWTGNSAQTRTPHPMAEEMLRDFPEVIDVVSISPIWGPGLTRPVFTVRNGDKVFEESGFFSGDTNFFSMFSFKMIEGNPDQALKTIGGLVITESMAQKYFGNESVFGKRLMINENPNFNMMITGVIEDVPENSHFKFDFLISYLTLKAINDEGSDYYEWSDFGHYNYIKLEGGTDPKKVEQKIPKWVVPHLVGWNETDLNHMLAGNIGFQLQPLLDIHLHSNIKWELEANGDINYVYIFLSAAFLILLIACINFMNLTIARAMTRTKEIGIRKVVGAERNQLFYQFLGETIIAALIAIFISTILVYFTVPYFMDLTNSKLLLNTVIENSFLVDLIIIAIIAVVIAGSYPALYLSGLQPVKILKGEKLNDSAIQKISKGLVVFQFAVSIMLIISAQIVSSQLQYMSDKKLGFTKEQLVVIPLKGDELKTKYREIKDELKRHESIVNATAVSNVPGTNFNRNGIRWIGEDDDISASEFFVDYDILETLEIELVEGRGFDLEQSTDANSAFILNETAARGFDWDTPVGKEIEYLGDMFTRKGKVIGIVKDFHFKSLHNSIEPLVLQIAPNAFNYMIVRISTQDINNSLNILENVWKDFDSVHNFDYYFLEDSFNNQYKAEQQMQELFKYFTILAVFIAAMGLLGLSILSTRKRVKEIGIRKALGSSVPEILKLIVGDYLKLVLVANVISWPVVYYVMSHWLHKFAYKTEISILAFIAAGVLIIMITTLIVVLQAVKAANINPVDSLRSE